MDFSDLGSSLLGNVVDLSNTATLFGQGAIASDISGNPIYSLDPAAVSYATGTAAAAKSGSSNLLLLLLLAFLAYKLLK